MLSNRQLSIVTGTACLILAISLACARPQAAPGQAPAAFQQAPEQKQQLRAHGQPVSVDASRVTVDDGDTVVIHWPDGDDETVRILGIDTPETRHDEHGIPLDQPFGKEARAFARGAFAVSSTIELNRADKLDPYGRTLGYLILNGKNYSVLVVRARLSEETVSHYGDNGLPGHAAEVMAAAKAAGPMPFEPPHVFRKRMRTLSDWQKNPSQQAR
jgi:micrococcal nuclease